MAEQWNIGEPGGLNGPFYSVVSSTGRVIAMQVPTRELAERIARLPGLELEREVGHQLTRCFSATAIRRGSTLSVTRCVNGGWIAECEQELCYGEECPTLEATLAALALCIENAVASQVRGKG